MQTTPAEIDASAVDTVKLPVQVESSRIGLWNKYYGALKESYLFPNEFVVRTFLGSYPNLTMKRSYAGASVCDIGCGDGRNITLLNKLGLKVHATEVTEEICAITRRKLAHHPDKIAVDLRAGFNDDLPFSDDSFDYALSWNACYYMKDEDSSISDHVEEFARVLKKAAYLVACVPGPDCFSLAGAEDLGNNLIRINNADPKWSLLNGSIYHQFRSVDDIEFHFGTRFENFQHCRLRDDCFGLPHDYFIFVCRKC